jgi:hypothetical protein
METVFNLTQEQENIINSNKSLPVPVPGKHPC